jgi:L-gulonate 3-dehydrogenase
MTRTSKTAAMIGTGLIGRSWAVAFARGGYQVRMFDVAPGAAEKSRALMPEMLRELATHGLLGGQDADTVMARVRVASSMAEAVSGADYVQESGPEKREIKAEIFSAIEEHAGDDTVLASSTSIILPSLFTGHLARKAQCVVAHPLNPPHIIPAIEIVPAPWTSPDILERARVIQTEIGQSPIVMKKEIDGFLMNRLQGALLEECFRLIEGGYASAEDIDAGLKDGLAMRWSFIGPLETADLNAPGGIRDYVERYNGGYLKVYEKAQHRADWLGTPLDEVEKARRSALPLNKIQERQDWRDRQLMLLAAHKAATKS